MRSSTFFLTGLVAVAYAQIDASIIAEIPSCATGPLVSGISGSGCQITDSACICGNQKLISDLQTAVKAQCSEADLASKFSLAHDQERHTPLTHCQQRLSQSPPRSVRKPQPHQQPLPHPQPLKSLPLLPQPHLLSLLLRLPLPSLLTLRRSLPRLPWVLVVR